MPLVEPGMKIVFPVMFMALILFTGSLPVQRALIGGLAIPG
jgi:hypothetical protein